ncbi:MAG: MurR/RpiR family transcriptional regulator [Veillonellales bacterium]
MSFLKRIQENYYEMSPKNKKLATYLSKNYDKVVFQTAKALAKDVGVSEATVTRFATALGYNGYPDMIKALSEMVRNRITTVDRLQLSLQSLRENPAKDVMDRDMINIRRTVEELDMTGFQQAVTCIADARKIYIVSFRSAAALGTFLHYYLQMLLKNCTLVSNPIKLVDELVDAGPEDLVIGVSFARYTKLTVDGLQFAKERGARTLVITDTNTSPLVRHGDTVLLAHRDMAYFIDSLAAPLSLMNALIVAVSETNPQQTRHRLSELETLWKQHAVYHEE